jgi:serine/threonine-protein kinase
MPEVNIQNVALDLVELQSSIASEVDGLTVGDPIGSGSQRVVFEGTLEGEDCAVKVALADQLARTEREVAIGRTFAHPNLARVLSDEVSCLTVAGTDVIVFAEQRIEGTTLTSIPLPLSPCDTLELIADLAESIEYLSAKNVIHRDVSPKNIMARSNPANSKWVLLDVGVARHLDMSSLTETAMTGPGTPRYAAPEQFDLGRSRNVDGRTDIFALGVVAYEAVSGKLPYEIGDQAAALAWCLGQSNPLPLGNIGQLEFLLGEMMGPRQHERPRPDEMPDLIGSVRKALGCS